jgi:hypothetical protein
VSPQQFILLRFHHFIFSTTFNLLLIRPESVWKGISQFHLGKTIGSILIPIWFNFSNLNILILTFILQFLQQSTALVFCSVLSHQLLMIQLCSSCECWSALCLSYVAISLSMLSLGYPSCPKTFNVIWRLISAPPVHAAEHCMFKS